MTTYNKNFRVKNGLEVYEDAIVSGTVTVGEISDDSHAVTKLYVDSNMLVTVASLAPSSPIPGKMWFDEVEGRLKVYTGSSWITIATLEDAETLPDHIHDTSIDGDGLIETIIEES